MKKLLFILSVSLFFAACHQKTATNQAAGPATTNCVPQLTTMGTAPSATFTLAGDPVSDARKYVRNFVNGGNEDNFDQSLHYSVWYSWRAITSIYTAIPSNCDGIRFYFGKTGRTDKHFILVPVATLTGVPDQTCSDVNDHNDYFLTSSPGYAPATVSAGVGAPVFLSGITCPSDNDTCPKTTHYINCYDAQQFVSYPTKERMNATSEWFDKEVIREMINLIPNNGGIRFYFGKHLKATAHDTIARHGIIMMVTANRAGQQVDTLICLPKGHEYEKLKQFYALEGGGTNNGEECPTNCQGTQLP